MKHLLLSSAFIALASTASADVYKFDPGHTEVRFYYTHAGLAEQSGEWRVIDGEVNFDENNVAATTVSLTIDPASIDTGIEGLDGHLKSPDFFDVAAHPEISFTSTSVTQTGDNSVKLMGDLTIKGNSKPVAMDLVLNHNGPHPMGGFSDYFAGQWIGVQGSGTLNRSEFGLGMMVPVVSDEIRIEISTEMRAGGWN